MAQNKNKQKSNYKNLKATGTSSKFANHQNLNKSPDIVGSNNRLFNNSKEREKTNININNHYSATKSQANITNNNFAKFSSSGYTNNAFLLMSGHHDFTQNDFHASVNMDTIEATG